MSTEKVTAHLANERTVARFGLALTTVLEVFPGIRYSSIVGIALVMLGGTIELFAFQRYRNKTSELNRSLYIAWNCVLENSLEIVLHADHDPVASRCDFESFFCSVVVGVFAVRVVMMY